MTNLSTNFHSEPFREIMTQIPNWIIRWGMGIIFSILLILIVGSFLIKHSEIITVPIITSNTANGYIISNVCGKIDSLFVKEGDIINYGEKLGFIKPNCKNEKIIRTIIPTNEIRRMRIGQNVKIHFFESCKTFNATIKAIVQIHYMNIAEIEITNSTPNFEESFRISCNLNDSAKIILKEERLISRFLASIKLTFGHK